MSLINCPECKKGVSDSAEACPNCGFGIKEYILAEKRKIEYAEKQKIYNDKIDLEKEKLKAELNLKLKEVDDEKKPNEPKLFEYLNIFSGLNLAIVSIILLLFFITYISKAYIFVVLTALALVAGIGVIVFFVFIGYSDYESAVSLYNKQMTNWDEYKDNKKKKIINEYNSMAYNMAMYNQRETPFSYEKNESNLKCPICNSTDVTRVTTMNRAASVAMVGIASGKIGKQYKCNNCNHLW